MPVTDFQIIQLVLLIRPFNQKIFLNLHSKFAISGLYFPPFPLVLFGFLNGQFHASFSLFSSFYSKCMFSMKIADGQIRVLWWQVQPCVQSYKTVYACKLPLYSRNIGNFLVSTTLVIIYERNMFISLSVRLYHSKMFVGSVTRFDNFRNFQVTNFITEVAQINCDFLAVLKNVALK